MKILFPISSLYPAQCGGPSNSVYWLAKALTKKGISVITVTTNRGIKQTWKFDSWINTKYGKVIYLTVLNYKYSIKVVLISLVQVNKTDIVHLSSLFYPPSIFIAIWAVLNSKQVVWSPRGELFGSALQINRSRKKLWIAFINVFLKSKISFHSTSTEESLRIQEKFGAKVSIVKIPNLIEPTKNIVRSDNSKYLLFLGRIHPIKAVDNLIKACGESNLFKSSNLHLKIVGNYTSSHGDYLQTLSRKLHLQNKIVFVGQVEGKEKENLLANAYFLILPSHSENFGNVVLEAMVHGTPVITSTGTPWSIVETNKCGFWVENSIKKLHNVINYVIQLDDNIYKEYRKNAKSLVETQFNVSTKIDTWVQFYNSLLS